MDLLTNWPNLLIWGAAGAATLYGLILASFILKLPAGNEKMTEVASAIQEGALSYLLTQYKVVAATALVVALLIYYFLGLPSAQGFVLGAVTSAFAGMIGMLVSVRANVRT